MRGHGLGQWAIVVLVGAVLLATVAIVLLSQALVERDAFNREGPGNLGQRQVEKITAEIRQIRSETGGSLFWLKMIAVFVTVGGAVGGYLLAQSQATHARLNFEHRKDIDAALQSIVQELSAKDSPLLRAAAAVKLGGLLESFPSEWDVDTKRQEQIIQLTKQVLAAALAIEGDVTVLKAMSIAVARHPSDEALGDLRELNFSRARASDAYWARVDFTNADLYGATLIGASFRKAVLHGTQFVDADLQRAVFAGAKCEKTNFKRADLRKADLSDATLTDACFEDAKVYEATVARVTWTESPFGSVDTSPDGDGSAKVPVLEWLRARDICSMA